MDLGVEPGLMTDELLPFGGSGLTYPALVQAGFTWTTYQAYNPNLFLGIKEFDLAAVRAHGFKSVGIWGVIYDRDDFYHAGRAMGSAAMLMKADDLIINTEQVYKGTRPERLGKQIIKGVRDGGWTKAVSLSTLGAPWTPLVNDYQMDEQSFLETGGSIMPQAYYNESEGYEPVLCKQYLDRLKIPQDKQNYTIALYPGKRGRIGGAGWIPLLEKAKIGKNFNCYMIQHMTQNDVTELSGYIKKPTSTGPSALKTRSTMINAANEWLSTKERPQPLARIQIAERIVQAENTDDKWNQVRNQIKALLDKAGIP